MTPTRPESADPDAPSTHTPISHAHHIHLYAHRRVTLTPRTVGPDHAHLHTSFDPPTPCPHSTHRRRRPAPQCRDPAATAQGGRNFRPLRRPVVIPPSPFARRHRPLLSQIGYSPAHEGGIYFDQRSSCRLCAPRAGAAPRALRVRTQCVAPLSGTDIWDPSGREGRRESEGGVREGEGRRSGARNGKVGAWSWREIGQGAAKEIEQREVGSAGRYLRLNVPPQLPRRKLWRIVMPVLGGRGGGGRQASK